MKKALFPFVILFVTCGCHKDNGFTPNYNSPSIPPPQITNFDFQPFIIQYTDQTSVGWSGDTLQFQTNNGQNTVIMWFVIDQLKDTTYTFDANHGSISLYNFQGSQIGWSYGLITASFYFQSRDLMCGNVQGQMQDFESSPGIGNGSVSFENLGIPSKF